MGATQNALDLSGRLFAETAFAGDAHTVWQPAGKGFADHLLGFAVAIARREVKEVDAAGNGLMCRRHAFVERRRAPHHAEPAATHGQGREGSLKRLRLARLDLFFLHSNVVPDAEHIAGRPDAASRMTLYRPSSIMSVRCSRSWPA